MTSSSPCGPPGPPPPHSSPSPRPRPPSRPRSPAALLRDRRVLGPALALLLAAAVTAALPLAGDPAGEPTDGRGRAAHGAGAGERERQTRYPWEGAGGFTTATGDSPVRGVAGPVWRYRVAVESDIGQDVAAFAATVDEVLADPRGWTASEELRVQRVAEAADADFTVYLATPGTSERMCAEGGLSTEGYTSCRLPGQVIINLARWLEAVPDYGAPLEVYRAYVVNHEVGHEFGEVHQACPAPGEPAPVMQQQTYGLDGCAANAWPYVDGSRYEGEVVPGI